MRVKRFSTSCNEKSGPTDAAAEPTQNFSPSPLHYSRTPWLTSAGPLCRPFRTLLRAKHSSVYILVNSTASLTSENELLTSHFFAPCCESTWRPCFFSIINMYCAPAPSRFGCWYKIHNGCQNLQFSLLFYEVRQYYMHWYIPFSQLKTFSFEPDRVRESWFCKPRMWNAVRGAGG